MSNRIEISIGMRVRLRKLHPCGSDTWTITRIGADVGIVCTGCGRRVMLEREEFERRVRSIEPEACNKEVADTEKAQTRLDTSDFSL